MPSPAFDSSLLTPGLRPDDQIPTDITPTEAQTPGSLPAQLWASMRHNHLLRSAVFLTATSAATAGLGFVFWAVAARLYSPADVGIATPLISTVSLISYLSLFGINATISRYFVGSRQRNGFASFSVLGVVITSVVLGLGAYLLVVAGHDGLGVVSRTPLFWLIFVAACVFASVNQLTDSFFIALRQSQYNVITDGLLQGVVKIVLPFALIALGALGIFTAVSAASVLAAALSLLLAWKVLRLRPSLAGGPSELLARARFSLSSYLANVFYLLPILVVPLIVLAQLGPLASGSYYIAYQISNLINAVGTAIGESLLAEGAYGDEYRRLLKRSAMMLAAVVLPAALLLALLAAPVLSIFGPSYVEHATGLLRLLAINSIFASLITWAGFALRVVGRMRLLLVANAAYCLLMIGQAQLLVGRGLSWVGYIWIGSGLLISAVLVVAIVRSASDRQPALES